MEKPHAHSYTALVTEPTCTEEGFTTYTCECGDTNGIGDGTFGISNPCNRAHAVTFMYRALVK